MTRDTAGLAVVITHFASTPERDEILRLCLDGVDRMRAHGPLVVCLVSGTPIPPDLAARCEASLFLGGNPGHVAGEARLVRRGLELAGWFGVRWICKLASDCVIRDGRLPWRSIEDLVARGKRLLTCKWGHNRSLGTLSFVGERSLLAERFPDLEASPRAGNLENIFFEAMHERLEDVLLLHSYDLDYLRVQERGGVHCHSLDHMRAFVERGDLPPGVPALWFVPHEDRWAGVERSLCVELAEDPRNGRPPVRRLDPVRLRVVDGCVGRGAIGLGGQLGYGGQVVVARERFVNAISAHAPSHVTIEVVVADAAGQVVHLGLALNDDAYAALQPGDHPMFHGLVMHGPHQVVADLGWVGVVRHVAWAALELGPGVHRLTLVAGTDRPAHCRSVWLFENEVHVLAPGRD